MIQPIELSTLDTVARAAEAASASGDPLVAKLLAEYSQLRRLMASSPEFAQKAPFAHAGSVEQAYGFPSTPLSLISKEAYAYYQVNPNDKVRVMRLYTDEQLQQMLALFGTLGEAAVLPRVDGDRLIPIGSKVKIHLASQDAWVEHTVVGYYVWPNLNGQPGYRVFVRVRHPGGSLNARLLDDVQPVEPASA